MVGRVLTRGADQSRLPGNQGLLATCRRRVNEHLTDGDREKTDSNREWTRMGANFRKAREAVRPGVGLPETFGKIRVHSRPFAVENLPVR